MFLSWHNIQEIKHKIQLKWAFNPLQWNFAMYGGFIVPFANLCQGIEAYLWRREG